MNFATIKIAGADAVRIVEEYRSQFAATGRYPFLIGDRDELELIRELGEYDKRDPVDLIRSSLRLDLTHWIAKRRSQFSFSAPLGKFPGEILEKGSISLHKDGFAGKFKSEVYLGLATIDEPWQLPAILKFGDWDECPPAEVHCAFHREWQKKFGAEIVGMSASVMECTVADPPTNRADAVRLAREQYWYCRGIVEQGCESVSNLAATLLNSPYWYFWWD